jgi:serine/threonine-protein kinase SRPK3
MIETLGLFDKDWALSGRYSKKFFNKYGVLKKVKKLRFWHLRDVLIEKYRFVPE